MAKNHTKTLRKCHQAFNAQDFDAAQTLVADGVTVTDHGRGQTMTSRAEFRGWMEAFYDMSSNMQIVDARYIEADDGWVAAQFRAVGEQDGPAGPFPASGKPFSLDVCELWHFNQEGQADEGHNYSDGLGLMMQLGHVGTPEIA